MTAMAPLVTAMCIAAGFGPSRSLLALLFGAQFGGFVTLVGVGSNATANEVMAQNGLEPFGFFSITPLRYRRLHPGLAVLRAAGPEADP